VGIILVYLYTIVTFKSLFISSCMMYQIFMSFFGANLIYRYLWPTESGIGYKYFALFNGLSIFIILGIGADDGIHERGGGGRNPAPVSVYVCICLYDALIGLCRRCLSSMVAAVYVRVRIQRHGACIPACRPHGQQVNSACARSGKNMRSDIRAMMRSACPSCG
jgi:hypothetical protein